MAFKPLNLGASCTYTCTHMCVLCVCVVNVDTCVPKYPSVAQKTTFMPALFETGSLCSLPVAPKPADCF